MYVHNQTDLVLCPSGYTKNVLKHDSVKREISVVSDGRG